jgi:hypothetical protein
MRDRLSELVRQRALVLEHLAWLDREIADASATPAELTRAAIAPAPAVPPDPAPTPISSTGTYAAGAPAPPAHAVPSSTVPAASLPGASTPAARTGDVSAGASDEIIEQYRVSPATVQQDVRKGCLLYFVAAFLLLGLVVAILYYTIGTR